MEFKNKEIIPVSNFLSQLKLPAKTARGVAKLQKSLGESLKELQDSEKDLIEKFDGKIDGNNIKWADGKAPDGYIKEHDALMDETVDIKPRYKEEFSVLKEYFKDYNGDIDPQYLAGFDIFFDQIEPIEETN